MNYEHHPMTNTYKKYYNETSEASIASRLMFKELSPCHVIMLELCRVKLSCIKCSLLGSSLAFKSSLRKFRVQGYQKYLSDGIARIYTYDAVQ